MDKDSLPILDNIAAPATKGKAAGRGKGAAAAKPPELPGEPGRLRSGAGRGRGRASGSGAAKAGAKSSGDRGCSGRPTQVLLLQFADTGS